MIGETCASQRLVVERLDEPQCRLACPLTARAATPSAPRSTADGHGSSGEGGMRVVPRTPSRTKRDLVDVAPAPVLAGLERADDRVRRGVVVRSRVAVGRVVAAADVAAGEADPEVQPLAAVAQAILAAVDGRRELAAARPASRWVQSSLIRLELVGAARCCVDELHCHRSFAHGCCAPFAGPRPDVAGGEDAGHARLEQVVGADGVAGEDEAVGSARDGVVEPFRARLLRRGRRRGTRTAAARRSSA